MILRKNKWEELIWQLFRLGDRYVYCDEFEERFEKPFHEITSSFGYNIYSIYYARTNNKKYIPKPLTSFKWETGKIKENTGNLVVLPEEIFIFKVFRLMDESVWIGDFMEMEYKFNIITRHFGLDADLIYLGKRFERLLKEGRYSNAIQTNTLFEKREIINTPIK